LTIPQIRPLLDEYIAKNGDSLSGSLHGMHDGHVTDDDIDYCINYAFEKHDFIGCLLARLIKKMTKTQRLKISYIIFG
jgi:hypothetical protein